MKDQSIQFLSKKFSYIHSQSFNQKNLRFSSKFILSLLKNSNVAYIYRENKGFCIFSCSGVEAEIITMAILPKYQNQGVGYSIIKEMEEMLLKINCAKMFLEVASNNFIALHLYKKSGFKQCGIRKNYYSISQNEKINAIVMEKIIKFKIKPKF